MRDQLIKNNNYGMEKYSVKKQKSNRFLLTILRTLNHKLPVNVDRYAGVTRVDRICSKCDAYAVGNEYHVPFVCNSTDIVVLRAMYLCTRILRLQVCTL